MKKILGVLGFCLGLGLIICIVMGFTTHIDIAANKGGITLYKFLTGIEYFLLYLPVITITGYVISCSVHFGHNPEGSSSRFSKSMVDRYKIIMISSLIIVFVLTISSELCGVLVKQGKNKIVNRPKLINEYVKVGNNLFDNGYYERAIRYADAALKLDVNAKGAAELRDKSDVEINRVKTTNLRFKLYESVEEASKVDKVVIDAQQINAVYKYYLLAQNAFEKKEWFNAHYYAEIGIGLATPKDPNLEGLKKISTTAWNNLSEYHNLAKTDDQLAFDRKYEGYLALVEKDDLKAYYIFRELYQSSREFQSDPDVVFYMQIAENRINERCFFVDETFELESFENVNDVYFACGYEDGSKDIIYFKGMTSVEETGNSIQYLRDLSVTSIDNNGDLYRTMHVPYAKVLPVSVKTLTPTTKSLMGINDKINFIPYIMLKSVGRETPNTEISPVYTYSKGETVNSPEYLLLSISYDDFLMLENASSDPEAASLGSLFKFVSNATKYGYSEEIYGQALMSRLFYPLWILILFILLSSFAWNNRIGINQYFKFSWILAMPAFLVFAGVFYRLLIFVYKLLNYAFLGLFGTVTGMLAGFVFYAVLLIVVSLYFLARQAKI